MTDTPARFRVLDQKTKRIQHRVPPFRYLIERRVTMESIEVWTLVAAAHDFDTAQMVAEHLEEYEEYRDEVAQIDGTAA